MSLCRGPSVDVLESTSNAVVGNWLTLREAKPIVQD